MECGEEEIGNPKRQMLNLTWLHIAIIYKGRRAQSSLRTATGVRAFSGNVSCTLLCLEHRVGTAALFFACSIPPRSHKKQHGAEIYHSSFSAEETTSERSDHLPRVHKTWISSDHTVDSTAMLRRDQRARDSLRSEAPSSERSQRPLTPGHPPICLGFPKHSTLLALVWANRSVWCQEITTETIHRKFYLCCLPPGLLGAKETRKEGPFDKEALTPGGLEQGFMNVDEEVVLGGHRDTSQNNTESHNKEAISSSEVSFILCCF